MCRHQEPNPDLLCRLSPLWRSVVWKERLLYPALLPLSSHSTRRTQAYCRILVCTSGSTTSGQPTIASIYPCFFIYFLTQTNGTTNILPGQVWRMATGGADKTVKVRLMTTRRRPHTPRLFIHLAHVLDTQVHRASPRYLQAFI